MSRQLRYDEHDRFDRPQRRTRPRTKDRPDYSAAEVGVVVGIDRGRYTVILEGDADGGAAVEASTETVPRGEGTDRDLDDRHEGPGRHRTVIATKARQLGRKGVIVGDNARVVGDTSGAEGTLGRIVEVLERSTVLRRTADDDDPYERPIVANADQLAIVTALADPPPRMGMIDRILVAGYDAGLDPLLVLTKADLASPDELLAAYAGLGVRAIVVEPTADLTTLRDLLAGHRTVFIGHSGVGKSTLVNRLIPDAHRAIGHVNEVTGRGRHTSTSAVALELPDPGGWVIDTPGVRSFGLNHVTTESILDAFDDLAALVADCPRGCQHDSTAPECALDVAVTEGRLPADRLESFRRMEKVWTTPATDARPRRPGDLGATGH